MFILSKVKWTIIGLYVILRLKYYSYKYNQLFDELYEAYTNLYFNFPILKMMLENAKWLDKNFYEVYMDTMEAKRMLESVINGDTRSYSN